MNGLSSKLVKATVATGLSFSLLFSATPLLPVSSTYAAEVTPSTEVKVKLPKIQVIATGGTIAGKSVDETSFQNYRAGTLLMADMLKALPNLGKIADVTSLQFGNAGSGSYTMQQLYDLSLKVDQVLESQDGVVVTTGTDTMEEIAYFLDLTVRSSKPVVITGSMRPWTVVGSDAQANLFNAIKLAASGKTKYYGTVLMLNDEIHTAREVTKTNAYRTDTFETPKLGMLGYIDENNIRIYRANSRALLTADKWATPFDLTKIKSSNMPKVEIAYAYQDAGAGAINGFVQDGARGIVTAGTGAGGLSKAMSEARSKAIKDKGVIFVSTTRTGSGSNYTSGDGMIAGDNLNAAHARILLELSLSFSSDFNTIKGWFETYGSGQIAIADK